MKKIFTICLLCFSAFTAFSQAPEKMSYQSVIRNSSNVLLTSQNVGIRISILQGSATGTAVYVETQSPTTNANGLVSIEIGNGTIVSGTFNAIDWSNGPFFVKTETDPAGGTAYSITGTSQLLSVPYALYAKTSGSSTPGPQGVAGTNGLNSLVKSTTEAAGLNCAVGGIKVEYGLDADNNGSLDASEVDASLTTYICNGTQGVQGVAGTNGTDGSNGTNGTNGLNSLSRTSIESAGTNCSVGGIKVEYGLDADGNGILDAAEVDATLTRYVCNGEQGIQGIQGNPGIQGNAGINGTNGTNGLNSLSKTTTETAGSNCATGGIKVEYGLDANSNGVLDAGEVNASLTRYVCNGAQGIQGVAGTNGAAGTNGTNGTNGKNSLSKTTTETAGSNCATGGIKVEYGLDANSNGVLDAGEVNASLTRYVCNGAQGIQGIQGTAGTNGTNGAAGTNGTNGKNSLSKTTTETAGSNCATGGIKVEYGLDANSNGVLDAGEINASLTRYVCNGAQGIQGIQGTAGTNGTNGAAGTNGTNGLNSLSRTTAEAAGANCATGGIRVEYGLDANSNGVLDAGEVNALLTRYVCNGAQGIQGTAGTNGTNGVAGTNGTNGTNGLNSLSKTTAEAPGANCATGGTKIESGLDANGNGSLDAGEINASLTRYVCNGAQGTTGANGKNTIVKTTTEAAGANCAGGGVKLEYGLDDNGNGTLEAGEINGALTKYVCNGDPGQHPMYLQTNSTVAFPSLNIGKGILMMVKVYTQCSSTATGGLVFIQNNGDVSVLSSAGSQGSYLSASGNVLSLVNGCVAPWTWTFSVSGGNATVTQGGASGFYQEAKWQILGN